jgi:hypothetical protein
VRRIGKENKKKLKREKGKVGEITGTDPETFWLSMEV